MPVSWLQSSATKTETNGETWMMQTQAKRRGRVLAPFKHQWTVLLTTYRRDGTAVATPVNIAVDPNGDRAFMRTWDATWKYKRIRNNPEVEIAPCTRRGRPTGPAIHARARILSGAESEYAAEAINRKHPFFQRILVRLAHRLRGFNTTHIELTPIDTFG
jgi:PPOX class probable F420-dependent enzyme